MHISRISSWNCIKSNAEKVVKQTSLQWRFLGGIFVVLAIFSVQTGHAEEAAPVSPSPTPLASPTASADDPENEKLPDIEAKTYDVKVVRRSSSNKIYLFDDITRRNPPVGRLLLLKKNDEAMMAFRIMRTYQEDGKIAAKRIKRYGGNKNLDDDGVYLAIEKISDLAPPPNTSQDNADLKELEGAEKLKVLPYDPDLDATTTQKTKEVPEEEEKDDNLGVVIEETQILDHYIHWLTAGFGYVKNYAPPAAGGGYHYFSAGNLRYGISLGRMVFFDKNHLQDSIVLEAGAHLYKALNYSTQGDAYTILGLAGSLRYNLLFSESFGIFIYGGVIQSFVLASAQADSASLQSLASFLPAVGGGFLFQVGPGWYTRVDVGLDTINLNLLLRF